MSASITTTGSIWSPIGTPANCSTGRHTPSHTLGDHISDGHAPPRRTPGPSGGLHGRRARTLLKSLALAALTLASLGTTATAVLPEFPIPDLYNTGVDSGGNALSRGLSDPHWIVSASPQDVGGGPINHYNGTAKAEWFSIWTSFTSNTGTSTWISVPNATVISGFFEDQPVNTNKGLFAFETTFTLPSDFVSAKISGNWSADNYGGLVPDFDDPTPDPNAITNFINLNGNDIDPGQKVYGFSPVGFDITSGFVPGTNVLQFYVSNVNGSSIPNPIGTHIVFTTATYAVPEPGSVALAVSGLAGLGGLGLLRRRRAARQGAGPRNAG